MILDNVNENIKNTFKGVARKGGSWSVRIAPFVNRLSKQPTILDKSVDRFEQNKRIYRRPSVIKKQTNKTPPFQCCTPWALSHGYNIEKGRGGKNLKIEKLARSTKQVFFRKCLSCFCPWLYKWQQAAKTKWQTGEYSYLDIALRRRKTASRSDEWIGKLINKQIKVKHIFRVEARSVLISWFTCKS